MDSAIIFSSSYTAAQQSKHNTHLTKQPAVNLRTRDRQRHDLSGLQRRSELLDMDNPFASFFAGGFECATHRRADRRQIDVIDRTYHDFYAEADYRLLQQVGIFTVRDGLRWHLIERQPGVYDWSSFLSMLHASIDAGTQVIWDLCHWGLPPDLDIFSEEFVARFAAFARAAAEIIKQHTDTIPFFCAINEISFWAWVGGDVGAFHPHMEKRGPELKRQLVRASLAAIHAVRIVDARARFVQPEPIINIVADPHKLEDRSAAEIHTASQYETWDWLAADVTSQTSGLDIIGINFYWNNQWVHRGERAPLGHSQHRPMHEMLLEVWSRYKRPIFISETGAESGAGAGWLGYISAEVRQAQRLGVAIVGICLYPVMDYPGWDDDRHCFCGLIETDETWRERSLREGLSTELHNQQMLFSTAR